MFFTVQYICKLLHTRQNLGLFCLFTLYSINRENNKNIEHYATVTQMPTLSPGLFPGKKREGRAPLPFFLGKSTGDEVDTDTNEFYIKFSPQFSISSGAS